MALGRRTGYNNEILNNIAEMTWLNGIPKQVSLHVQSMATTTLDNKISAAQNFWKAHKAQQGEYFEDQYTPGNIRDMTTEEYDDDYTNHPRTPGVKYMSRNPKQFHQERNQLQRSIERDLVIPTRNISSPYRGDPLQSRRIKPRNTNFDRKLEELTNTLGNVTLHLANLDRRMQEGNREPQIRFNNNRGPQQSFQN
jgi:hypothetical protein